MTDGSLRAAASGAPATGARYGRILLKLSGEALLGSRQYGVDPTMCLGIAAQVKPIRERGVASSAQYSSRSNAGRVPPSSGPVTWVSIVRGA